MTVENTQPVPEEEPTLEVQVNEDVPEKTTRSGDPK